MTARRSGSSPASSRARSSAVIQPPSGSPQNARYRARRRRNSARAGPAGVPSMTLSSRARARAGSDASKRCSAARTDRRRRLSDRAGGVRGTASSARSPAVSQAPRRAAIWAAASSSPATASSGPSAPRARWRARASGPRTTTARRRWAARRSAARACPATTERISGWTKTISPSTLASRPAWMAACRSACAVAVWRAAALMTGSASSAASELTRSTSRVPGGRPLTFPVTSRSSESGTSGVSCGPGGMLAVALAANSSANSGFPPDVSCSRRTSDRPGHSVVRVASSSRIAPRLRGPSVRRSTLSAGTLSVASRGGSAGPSVRTAASRPTGSSRRRRSAKDSARADGASSHGRSSMTSSTGCSLASMRSSVSTAVATVRGSAGSRAGSARRTAWRTACRWGAGSPSTTAAGSASSKSARPPNSNGISDSTGDADRTVIPSGAAVV